MPDLFPPFVPDRDEPKKRLFRPISIRVVVPNIITLMALCLGLTAIRFAYDERWSWAVYSILGAAVLDGLDGRVARFLKGTSRFGAELDSLADFVSFGVAPALLLYSFSLNQLKSIGWLVALIFAMSMALRLARFNAMIDDPTRPEWQKNYFTGVPAPAGALLVMLPVYLYFCARQVFGVGPGSASSLFNEQASAVVIILYTLVIAFLTICTLPIYSGKNIGLRMPRAWVLPLFFVLVVGVALILSFPFPMLALIVIGYLASIPVGVAKYRQIERAEAARAPADGPESEGALDV